MNNYSWFWQRHYSIRIVTLFPVNEKGYFIRGYGTSVPEAMHKALELYTTLGGKAWQIEQCKPND